MSKKRLAVPSVAPGGLSADCSGHFGRCDCFTVVDVEEGKVIGSDVIQNPPHVHGGCMRPVQLLSAHQVDSLVVQGIGGGPLSGFRRAGIEVYQASEQTVEKVVDAFCAGKIAPIDDRNVCSHH
ncbi:NifB/NifX family molybdenum-iron cluster-binding protein [Heliobacterium chlorum]|uniref:NifB/NifX family molybdenum-iron cluster-binding protein n=1 Tax=Heliobacterium chlorum TaxID=2698 RepID=A0ABR7SYU5_HELCL|nr:NifB/NifX family molybdenum-iron cluster-binding protein [Heliobacterium chlorum]MBC9783710.1 NifB/NifX family molybdenum-iron cluster-binding protein [Heliobacterium chlorum]